MKPAQAVTSGQITQLEADAYEQDNCPYGGVIAPPACSFTSQYDLFCTNGALASAPPVPQTRRPALTTTQCSPTCPASKVTWRPVGAGRLIGVGLPPRQGSNHESMTLVVVGRGGGGEDAVRAELSNGRHHNAPG